MANKLYIVPGYEKFLPPIDGSRPLHGICEHFGLTLGEGTNKRSRPVRKVLKDPDGSTMTVFLKLYGYGRLRRSLSRMAKPSRSCTEMRNLRFFRELGIPACEVIAQGEIRNRFGIIRNCLIITREIPGCRPLDVFIDELESSDEDIDIKADLRRQILISLVTNLRLIHQHGFYHKDLHWRNILVRRVGDRGENAELFWIDCPSGYFDRTGGLCRNHGVVRDLATLDHMACQKCSTEERLHFLSEYVGKAPDDPELVELGRQVVDYRKRKFDD